MSDLQRSERTGFQEKTNSRDAESSKCQDIQGVRRIGNSHRAALNRLPKTY